MVNSLWIFVNAEAMRNCVEYQWFTIIEKFDERLTGSQEVASSETFMKRSLFNLYFLLFTINCGEIQSATFARISPSIPNSIIAY